MELVNFSEIVDALRQGREIEFAFNKEKYGIVNGGGVWFLSKDTEPKRVETLCDFDDKDKLVDRVSQMTIDGVSIPDIFDHAKYDLDFIYIL